MTIKNIIFDLYGVLINRDGLMHDTADILKLCARHPALRCYGLSNISEQQREDFVATYPILRNLKIIVTSEEAQAEKPSPKIFQYLMQIAHLNPAECLFIDDSPQNCEAAKHLGFHTIHFKNADQLAHALEDHAVPIFEAESVSQTESCGAGCSCHPK